MSQLEFYGQERHSIIFFLHIHIMPLYDHKHENFSLVAEKWDHLQLEATVEGMTTDRMEEADMGSDSNTAQHEPQT